MPVYQVQVPYIALQGIGHLAPCVTGPSLLLIHSHPFRWISISIASKLVSTRCSYLFILAMTQLRHPQECFGTLNYIGSKVSWSVDVSTLGSQVQVVVAVSDFAAHRGRTTQYRQSPDDHQYFRTNVSSLLYCLQLLRVDGPIMTSIKVLHAPGVHSWVPCQGHPMIMWKLVNQRLR